MDKQAGEKMVCITNKGRAFLAAYEAGLIPKTDSGYDETKFEQFWDAFEKDMNRCEYCPGNQQDRRSHLWLYLPAVVMSAAALIISIALLGK